jgi:hypothetical protein
MNKYILFFICCLSVCVIGCSGKVSVEGTVTYPDGTPLTLGTVIFERENYQVAGQINANGHYRLGEIREGDGVLPGNYAVRVSAKTGGSSDGEPVVKYVAEKYENTATSGLTCEVNRSRRFDFTVEPFSK